MSKLSSTIPLRTSVHPEALAKVNPRYIRIGEKVEDITTIPMPMSLSVRHTQSMTALPQWRDGRVPRTRSLETGTAHQRPIVRTRSFDIADIRTFPPLITHPHVVRQNKFWSVLDTLRWWLLAPGRLERILWLCGTLLLIMLTGALVWFFIVGWRYCAL